MVRFRQWAGWGPLLMVLVMAACSPAAVPDEQAQEEVLTEYLTALQAGDEKRIKKLCQPGVDARAEIAGIVKRIGGRQWRDVEVSWQRGDFPSVASAHVIAVGPGGQRIAEAVELAKVDGKWWIALGSARPEPGVPPAGTARPG